MQNKYDERKGENLSRFPRYGWKIPLDHKFPEKRDQQIKPRLGQLPPLLPLFARYLIHYAQCKARGKEMIIDIFNMLNGKQLYGVPLGGIGSGTIGRGFKGEFCRYQMVPGIYEYKTVMANQFLITIRNGSGILLYQRVLSTYSKCKDGLSSWEWGINGNDALYCGLYPRSWTVYNIPEHSIRLICRQISPIIPNEYKDSCLPCGVFVWTVENNSCEEKKVTITFTYKNGTGGQDDKKGECWSESFQVNKETSASANALNCEDSVRNSSKCDDSSSLAPSSTSVRCVVLHQTIRGMNLKYCIGVKGELTSHLNGFNPCGSGRTLWNLLKKDGVLHTKEGTSDKTRRGEELCVAVSGTILLKPNSSGCVEMALSWDMPNIVFKGRAKTYRRRYTRWFPNSETAARDILCYALDSYKCWEDKIEEWQEPILSDSNLPDWFKSALFNELYYVADGGTLWLELDEDFKKTLPDHDPRIEYGRFCYLEGHEYRMYNTYDVHFYASWALILLWPHLQKSLQYDMAMWTMQCNLKSRTFLASGERGVRKLANAVPHDIGDPEDEPFVNVNSYNIHDVSQWKDLNLKFVLQVYRDYVILEERKYLDDMWPVCRAVMDRSFSYCDSDGLIANNGNADQTYDSWMMHGPSAYCCSLWIAALAVMAKMASLVGNKLEECEFSGMLNKSTAAYYDKLWNGEYFNFDSCNHPHSKSIMADQLVGFWYLKLSQFDKEIFRSESIDSAIKLIFSQNVMNFQGGTIGAVNGMLPNGTVDTYAVQSEEVWTGVTYSLASIMISQGMLKEGFSTAEGIYRTVYEKIGLGFETPEALYASNKYRAIGYMRPLSIWSMLRAYQLNKEETISKYSDQNGLDPLPKEEENPHL